MTPDGWIVLAILAAAIAAFASARLRVDAVGLGVLLALAVSGILTTGEAVAGFSDSSVLMIGGLFIVGEGWSAPASLPPSELGWRGSAMAAKLA
jgi:di/tricarboxylate transporter